MVSTVSEETPTKTYGTVILTSLFPVTVEYANAGDTNQNTDTRSSKKKHYNSKHYQ